jgi:uridylate kinase
MASQKTVLLKLTGEILKGTEGQLTEKKLCSIAQQIKALSHEYYFGIVIGGGNFFRGSLQGAALGISSPIGHQIGMLATMMNGLIIQDIFNRYNLATTLFCAIPTPGIGEAISDQALKQAHRNHSIALFTGGTGNPFFTTDTTAVLRALQMNASMVWKGTSVDGIYAADPKKVPHAKRYPCISFKEALQMELKIMDATAFALAQEHNLPIKVFNIFEDNALLKAACDPEFGSIIMNTIAQ